MPRQRSPHRSETQARLMRGRGVGDWSVGALPARDKAGELSQRGVMGERAGAGGAEEPAGTRARSARRRARTPPFRPGGSHLALKSFGVFAGRSFGDVSCSRSFSPGFRRFRARQSFVDGHQELNLVIRSPTHLGCRSPEIAPTGLICIVTLVGISSNITVILLSLQTAYTCTVLA